MNHWEVDFGFSIDNIDRALTSAVFSGPTTEEIGPHAISLVAGRFDPRAVPARIEACQVVIQSTVNHHLRQSYYSWREGLALAPEDRLRPPIFDNLGRGGHIVLTENHILFELNEEPFRAALEARLQRRTVLENDAIGLIAEERDCWSLLAVVIRGEPQSPALASDPADTEARLRPYEAFALGAGWEAGAAYTTVILAHRSDEDASENVTRLLACLEQATARTCVGEECTQHPWSDIFTSWHVEADGRLLAATLRGPARWTILFHAEPLLLHE